MKNIIGFVSLCILPVGCVCIYIYITNMLNQFVNPSHWDWTGFCLTLFSNCSGEKHLNHYFSRK